MITVFLVVTVAGAVQFLMPMKTQELCFTNGKQLAMMFKPDPTLRLGCFDATAQSFIYPRAQIPQIPHTPEAPEGDRVD